MLGNWWRTLKALFAKTEAVQTPWELEVIEDLLRRDAELGSRIAELEATVRAQGEALAALTRPPEMISGRLEDPPVRLDRDAVRKGIREASPVYTVNVEPGEPDAPESEQHPWTDRQPKHRLVAPERHKPLDSERFHTSADSIIGGAEAVAPDAVDRGQGIRFKALVYVDSLADAKRRSDECRERVGR